MNPEYTERLIAAFPALYRRTRSFECGDGWFDLLLLQLSCDLKLLIDAVYGEPPPVPLPDDYPHARGVQEKYGALRYDASAPEVLQGGFDTRIAAAEEQSACVCELCKKPAQLFERSGWWQTLCEKHGGLS